MTKGRFAPSPTGRMHLGNVFSAMLSWLSVRSKGGEWLLRIEDNDPQRSKQQYADLLMDDLEWLGMTWDEGPYYQSRRGEIYEHYLNELKAKGLIYPSYKTRAERLAVSAPQASVTPLPDMPQAIPATADCRGQETDAPHAECLRVDDMVVTYQDGHYGTQTVDIRRDIGDFIVRRRDGAWAYQLAVVVDDALMGVTEVVRGRDLLQSAGQQIYLGGLLGFPRMDYIHLPLLCNEAMQRLSKRDKSLDMSVLREHYTPEQIIGRLAFHAGLIDKEQPVSIGELADGFTWQKVPQDDIIMV